MVAFAGARARSPSSTTTRRSSACWRCDVLGSPWDKLVLLAIVTSAVASTQTTIIPASRTALSMARSGALPRGARPRSIRASARRMSRPPSSPRSRSPGTCRRTSISENFLFDSLSALALMIAFYYALSGLACVVYYRRELTKSVWNFVVHRRRAGRRGDYPRLPVRRSEPVALRHRRVVLRPGDLRPRRRRSRSAIGFILLGVVLMIVWRLVGDHGSFFARRAFERVDPAVAAGAVRVEEDPVT